MTPARIQLSRKRGWRMPPNTVKVSRPSIWGNPYLVCPQRTAKEAVRLYRMGLRGRWTALEKAAGHNPLGMLTVIAYFQSIRRRLGELRGKNLACWCRLGEPCHADVLLELAGAPLPKESAP